MGEVPHADGILNSLKINKYFSYSYYLFIVNTVQVKTSQSQAISLLGMCSPLSLSLSAASFTEIKHRKRPPSRQSPEPTVMYSAGVTVPTNV